MPDRSPRVYTISSGSPFLATLAHALLQGRLVPGWPAQDDPAALSDATLYLPTRRSARALVDFLGTEAHGKTRLLPRIVPLAGLDDVEDRLIFERGFDRLREDLNLLPDIDPTRRRLILTRLVLAWSARISATLKEDTRSSLFPRALEDGLKSDTDGFIVAASPQDALELADALGHLIDTLAIHGKTWEDVHRLVPSESDDYWRISRDFLEIAARAWPAFKSAHRVMDMAERHHDLIKAEALRLSQTQPGQPIIAAGSTGSMPATALLLAAIARLPKGAVVLPDLDLTLDAPTFSLLTDGDGKIREPSHPQAQLAHLLAVMGIARHDIVELGRASPDLAARNHLLSETMRPADATDLWRTRATRISDQEMQAALQSVSVIEADHEREEALAIALVLRETLETPDRTAALITPDRSLAERVSADLKRWSIHVEDSAGKRLKHTQSGILAQRFATALAHDFDPLTLISLLDHPLARFGLDADTLRRGRVTLDVAILRKPLMQTGLEGIRGALATERDAKPSRHTPQPRARLGAADFAAADRMIAALLALRDRFRPIHRDLLKTLLTLGDVLHPLAATPDDPRAFEDADGAPELSDLLLSLAGATDAALEAEFGALPAFLDRLMAGTTFEHRSKSSHATHPRLHIYGLLEARLLPTDCVIVAGLDEGIWPPETRTDPFLTRPARDELGLPSPERRIGQTAHDFVSALGASDVIISRALKRGGQPTVPSRFLQRLRALSGDEYFDSLRKRGAHWIDLARRIDESSPAQSLKQPRPIPPKSLLPDRLSITEIETLRRDPYSIYAKHVLKLDPLDPVGRVIGPSELGTLTHDAIGNFAKDWPDTLPDDALERLLEKGREAFGTFEHRADFKSFWWPRFKRIATWLIAWEKKRRSRLQAPLAAETYGRFDITLPSGGTVLLTGQADRIETLNDGTLAIIDFKTGKPPSLKQVQAGISPQLTIEAALALERAFPDVAALPASALLYVKLGGKDDGKEHRITPKDKTMSIADLVTFHHHELVALLDAHWNHARPFASRPLVEFASLYAKYDHLARVKEWSVGGDESEGEE